jgi:hypothetical protein
MERGQQTARLPRIDRGARHAACCANSLRYSFTGMQESSPCMPTPPPPLPSDRGVGGGFFVSARSHETTDAAVARGGALALLRAGVREIVCMSVNVALGAVTARHTLSQIFLNGRHIGGADAPEAELLWPSGPPESRPT